MAVGRSLRAIVESGLRTSHGAAAVDVWACARGADRGFPKRPVCRTSSTDDDEDQPALEEESVQCAHAQLVEEGYAGDGVCIIQVCARHGRMRQSPFRLRSDVQITAFDLHMRSHAASLSILEQTKGLPQSRPSQILPAV